MALVTQLVTLPVQQIEQAACSQEQLWKVAQVHRLQEVRAACILLQRPRLYRYLGQPSSLQNVCQGRRAHLGSSLMPAATPTSPPFALFLLVLRKCTARKRGQTM